MVRPQAQRGYWLAKQRAITWRMQSVRTRSSVRWRGAHPAHRALGIRLSDPQVLLRQALVASGGTCHFIRRYIGRSWTCAQTQRTRRRHGLLFSVSRRRPKSSCVWTISTMHRASSRSFALARPVLAPGGSSQRTRASSDINCLRSSIWWSRHVRFQCVTRSTMVLTFNHFSALTRETSPDPPNASRKSNIEVSPSPRGGFGGVDVARHSPSQRRVSACH